MSYFTTNTYQTKREIINFSNKISSSLPKPRKKFAADMTYGILASQSCLLTDITDQLHETSKKVNVVERLSSHLAQENMDIFWDNYRSLVRQWVPEDAVVHIDDTDVIKPDGHHFEALGIVRDGSKSTGARNVFQKGYLVTEACAMTKNGHPVSIFSHVHSSSEKNYRSANTVTFSAIQTGAELFGKATFVMDRGYDDNKMFLKLDGLCQDYVIRLTTKRKLFFHNKWVPATELCARRKGKVKLSLFYRGKNHDAYLSHVQVQITASRKDIYLVLVYGITEHPMMLATNREIRSKEDLVRVAQAYFSRWRIEEYFRCKKQVYQFEQFRVRKLSAINSLNFFLTAAMAFLGQVSMKSETSALKAAILKKADPVRSHVQFHYYRLAKGICGILSYAREGVRLWFRTKRPRYRQLCFRLVT